MMQSGRLSREEFKKQKAIEEGRKAGTIAPEVDEEGRDINPHIPEYISKVPWYINKGTPSLSHQRASNQKGEEEEVSVRSQRGRVGGVVTKYRKGACGNCGSMTHQTKECIERPRRRGAKLTGQNFGVDEVVEEGERGYDEKRDRWSRYDPDSFNTVFDRYKMIEVERRKKKAAELTAKQQEKLRKQEEKTNKKQSDGVDEDSDSDSDTDDEDKETDAAGATFSKQDPRTKSTMHNMRIREDRAKYLENLDPNSAFYEPKTRSMRENPLPHIDPNELVFAGDNMYLKTGEWKDFMQVQRYTIEAQQRGQDVNFAAAPSQAELGYKTFKEKQEQIASARKQAILQQYGGEEFLRKPEEDALVLEEKEVFVQFSRDGRVIGGGKKLIPKSKYPEDVYEHGHTSIWGSYWRDGKWGYACCKVTSRGTLCPLSDPLAPIISEPTSTSSSTTEHVPTTDAEDTHSDQDRKRKFVPLKEEENNSMDQPPSKRKKYNNQSSDYTVTEDDMEEYRRNQTRADDPMNNYVDDEDDK